MCILKALCAQYAHFRSLHLPCAPITSFLCAFCTFILDATPCAQRLDRGISTFFLCSRLFILLTSPCNVGWPVAVICSRSARQSLLSTLALAVTDNPLYIQCIFIIVDVRIELHPE